ncbi:MAG: AEC family transporter [Shimia sp.]
MTLALTVIEIVAPVFLLAGIGVAWVRAGWEYRVAFVTRLAMTLAVPCLIFVALMQTEAAPAALRALLLASIATYAAITAATWVVLRVWRLPIRTFLPPLIMGNTGNIGLPLALFAFGEVGLQYAVVVFAFSAVFSFTFGVWIIADTSNPLTVVREPMVGATLLGALFLWRGWETPEVLTNTLELIGQMAIPLMLLTLGVAVGRLRPANVPRGLALTVLKVAICAGAGFAMARAFGLDPVAAGVLVVQAATPVAVTNYLLAEKYGADAQEVAGLVVISTTFSVVSLPFLLALVL